MTMQDNEEKRPYCTEIIELEGDFEADRESILVASSLLRAGELVAFPTETVYGLGADGLNEEACRRIFQVKGRPADNPLILHVSDLAMAEGLIDENDRDNFYQIRPILDRLWPGPMTIIFRRSRLVPDVVTAGGPTVAIRMPAHPVALALIAETGRPIAAPSANRSGRPSPTRARDVFEDLDGDIPLVLDGGGCRIGIESTVIDLSQGRPQILRPGYYTGEYLGEFFPNLVWDPAIIDPTGIPRSPGQKYRHYAPKAEMILLVGDPDKVDRCLQALVAGEGDKKLGLLLFEENQVPEGDFELIRQGSIQGLERMSHDLFANLREFDRRGVEKIYAVGPDGREGLGLSIMNRMLKSASHHVIKCE